MILRRTTLLLLAPLLPWGACDARDWNPPESRLPERPRALQTAQVAEPGPEAEGTGTQARPTAEAAELPVGAREVDLRMNGAQVRVVRPSPANPFVVARGEFEDIPAPSPPIPPDDAAPRIALQRQTPIDVIRRVPQTLELFLSDPEGVGDVRGYYVQFDGYEGHFYIETEPDSEVFGAELQERGRGAIDFFMDEVFPPGQRGDTWVDRYHQPFDLTMRVWAVDREGHLSAPVTQSLHVLPVGRGVLEVTLSMSLATDLDLYVVEPNGNVIYYANPRSWTNGQLDLDANAACASNRNVRYEHIFWQESRVPVGTYQVRVDNWQNCVGGQPVEFQVIVQNCGDITVYDGVATGQGGQSDCRNPLMHSCQEIAKVEVGECDQSAIDHVSQAPSL